jgi:twitching motility protein PilJ
MTKKNFSSLKGSEAKDLSSGGLSKNKGSQTPEPEGIQKLWQWWKKQSLQFKATAIAISISSVPIVAVGTVTYQLAEGQLKNNMFSEQQSRPLRNLGLTVLGGSSVAAVIVAFLAAGLVRRAISPIQAAAEAVEKIGQGELETRLEIAGEDELAVLSSNINLMAQQIQELLRKQENAALDQLSAQSEIARQQTELAEQERQRSQEVQQELLKLLSDVEGAASGDLTVRAEISSGQIGIVADFFNAIVENLRDIVTQVKQSSFQVNQSLGVNETAVRQLATDYQKQAKKVERMLDFVEQMANSIQEVTNNAATAAEAARKASQTAELSGNAMDKTQESILQLRGTIAETAKKVKRLGESSQQISKVISLINEIALKTNLLAVNASIEAARAGEEGRGFAVVAEEVGQLAAQSATATKEIESIVESIQRETSQVVEAMEIGTSQVVEGTRMVEETKQSLDKIVQESRQIDQLVQLISQETVSQTKTSQMVTNFMKNIAEGSSSASESSRQVSGSLQETVAIAQKLQESVETFKVNPGTSKK